MLSGSLALNFYAQPRMTRDIDIVIELSYDRILDFMKLFSSDEYYIEEGSIKRAIQHERMFNIIHNTYLVKVDFIIRKNSPYAHMAFSRRCRVVSNNIPLWIISKEDLLIAKLIWIKLSSSELQTRDVRNLMSSVIDLDKQYFDHWVNELELTQVYKKVMDS